VAKRNERLERLITGSRELLRTIRIAVGGLRQDKIEMTRLGASLLDAIQAAGDEFYTVLIDVQGQGQEEAPPEQLPRRRGPGRPKRQSSATENNQDGSAEAAEVADGTR